MRKDKYCIVYIYYISGVSSDWYKIKKRQLVRLSNLITYLAQWDIQCLLIVSKLYTLLNIFIFHRHTYETWYIVIKEKQRNLLTKILRMLLGRLMKDSQLGSSPSKKGHFDTIVRL